ncbi:hypothetical protein [Ochrobactrum quorumnocens]|uniref:Thiol:disulfide interchange protein DsbG n=1 Tax=Ochrobactrum quorumnocens TaxID=271865 RepID=A0A5N1JYR2_9HYPH|nr:hypothetical protein [[Ochrobactrum] quorumnocens]KAA9368338.1 hypothetical protein F3W84_10645 [[Ochrobactrum] quorumnocens]
MNKKLLFTYYLLFPIFGGATCLAQPYGCSGVSKALSPYAEKRLHADGTRSKHLFTLDGLDVWMTQPADQKAMLVFTTPSGLLVEGTVFGPDGRDLTAAVGPDALAENNAAVSVNAGPKDAEQSGQTRAPKDRRTQAAQTTADQPKPTTRVDNADAAFPAFTTLSQLRSQADHYLMWIEANHSLPNAPVLYMFVDPQCAFCSNSLLVLKPYLDRGAIELRLVPTPILSPLSLELAVSFVQERNPGEAFIRHAARAGDAVQQQAVLPRDKMDKAVIDAMARNLAWFRGNGLQGVPLYLYRSDAGDQLFYGQIDDSRIDEILRGDRNREGDRLEQ